MIFAEFGQYLGHIQLFERRHIRRNVPKHGAVPGDLAKDVNAETSAFVGDIGEVEVVAAFERFDLVCRQDFPNIGFEFRVR